MLAKARACADWNVPMVWVVQDVFYNYIVRATKIELKSVPLRKVYNKPPSSHIPYYSSSIVSCPMRKKTDITSNWQR